MAIQDDLRQAAEFLRNAAPAEWEKFEEIFYNYTQEAIERVCEVEAHEMLIFKGHAQQCKALRGLFDV